MILAALLTCQQALSIANNAMNNTIITPQERYEIIQELDEASGKKCNFSLEEE